MCISIDGQETKQANSPISNMPNDYKYLQGIYSSYEYIFSYEHICNKYSQKQESGQLMYMEV